MTTAALIHRAFLFVAAYQDYVNRDPSAPTEAWLIAESRAIIDAVGAKPLPDNKEQVLT